MWIDTNKTKQKYFSFLCFEPKVSNNRLKNCSMIRWSAEISWKVPQKSHVRIIRYLELSAMFHAFPPKKIGGTIGRGQIKLYSFWKLALPLLFEKYDYYRCYKSGNMNNNGPLTFISAATSGSVLANDFFGVLVIDAKLILWFASATVVWLSCFLSTVVTFSIPQILKNQHNRRVQR